MRKFLIGWVFDFMVSDMKVQLIGVIVSISILVASYFTGEFQSVSEYFSPPRAIAFLYAVPAYLFITLFRCGLSYSRKYHALEEVLQGRKEKNKLVLKLSDLYNKYKYEPTPETSSSLIDDGIKYIRESGVISEATIYWFESQRNHILYPAKTEEVMNKLISELKWN